MHALNYSVQLNVHQESNYRQNRSIHILFYCSNYTAILFTRIFQIPYDRRVLVANILALLAALMSYFLGGIHLAPTETMSTFQKIYTYIALVLIANGTIQFLSWLFFRLFNRIKWVKMPRFLFDIISFLAIIGMTFYCLKSFDIVDLSHLVVTSTVLSAVIGLALQGTLSNFFSGLSLQLESPFNTDDWVNLGGFEGKIVSQNWRTATLLTRENHRVSLTNRFVSEDKIVNFSRPTRRQIHNFYICLDYSHPPNQVKNILLELLDEIKEIEVDKQVGVFVVDYLDSGIKYCLKYWIKDYGDIVRIQDTVLTRIWYRLSQHHIKIPYPISEIQMQIIKDEAKPEIDLSDHAIMEFLGTQDWLKNMDHDKLDMLANRCHTQLYAMGDLIVKQGEKGTSMFIIIDGNASVIVKGDAGQDLKIAEKNEGDFFGELSLLTGETRTATIKANKDCNVIVIGKDAFSSLLITDDSILTQFLDGLEQCKSGIANAIQSEIENANITKDSARQIIVNRIRAYLLV